jgi:hypothetical protein
MKKEKDFTCNHIKKKKDKSIYIYHLINRDLCLCERCGAKLMKQVIEQDKVEKEAKTIFLDSNPNGFLKEKDKIVWGTKGY